MRIMVDAERAKRADRQSWRAQLFCFLAQPGDVFRGETPKRHIEYVVDLELRETVGRLGQAS